MNNDLLEHAFGLLKARSHEASKHQFELEEKLVAMHGTSRRRYLSPLVKVAAVVVLCVVVGVAESATGVVSKVVSVFIETENGPEKVGDVQVNERGGVTVGVGIGFSGPGGYESEESGVATFEIDSSAVADGKVTLQFDVATDNGGEDDE